MAKRGEDSRYVKRLQREAAAAARIGNATTPFDAEIRQQRFDVLEGYLQARKELIKSTHPNDRQIAVELGGYIRALLPNQTRAVQGLEIHKRQQQRQVSSNRKLKDKTNTRVDGPKH
jgi:hypothetical protein